jgi:hypothetical protein
MAQETDNFSLQAKLDLRRFFLEKYHRNCPPHVIDCCQGDGRLWAQLRREYKLQSMWGLDVKAKPGRLRLASKRLLAQPGWKADVIDVDTYGSPWKHWSAMLPNVRQPVTVFLTAGQIAIGGGNADRAALAAMGLTLKNLPNSLGVKVIDMSVGYILHRCELHGLTIDEAIEALNPGGSARYFGVRLRPR